MSLRLDEMLSEYPSHLNVSDLSKILGVTNKTAYEYLQSGTIPAYRVISKWVILRDDIHDFLAESSIYGSAVVAV